MATSCTFASMSKIAAMARPSQRAVGVAISGWLRNLAVPALLALLLGVGCTSISTKLDSPVVTLETVRILSVAAARANIAMVLRLCNPTRFVLRVEGVEYGITIEC